MNKPTWVITGATSAISNAFAHLVAAKGCPLVLVGRDEAHMQHQACDLRLRHQVDCTVILQDFTRPMTEILEYLHSEQKPLALFLGHSQMIDNAELNANIIQALVQINILSTLTLIQTYAEKNQEEKQLIFLSSVACARGRSKNSLYGASKAAVEVYLQGLQQAAKKTESFTIARLGYIDTRQTYGLSGIFYAASPKQTAKACYRACQRRKSFFHYPSFWGAIMAIIKLIPSSIYRKLRF